MIDLSGLDACRWFVETRRVSWGRNIFPLGFWSVRDVTSRRVIYNLESRRGPVIILSSSHFTLLEKTRCFRPFSFLSFFSLSLLYTDYPVLPPIVQGMFFFCFQKDSVVYIWTAVSKNCFLEYFSCLVKYVDLFPGGVFPPPLYSRSQQFWKNEAFWSTQSEYRVWYSRNWI